MTSEWTDPTAIAAGIVIGLLLGAAYFGGLWWTVRRLPVMQHPLAFYFASFALRLAGGLAGFFWILVHFHLPGLIAGLVGFLGFRLMSARVFTRLGADTARYAGESKGGGP